MRNATSTMLTFGVCAAWFLAPPAGAVAQDADRDPTRVHGEAMEVQGESARESAVGGEAGAVTTETAATTSIGFIDSPGATCYQPDSAVNNCYINWYYLSVGASPSYIISMDVLIKNQVVARYQGFFQTSMYIPSSMHGSGFRVPCGKLGAGGNPDLGKAFTYTIRAEDSGGLKTANYGTVYCPAFQKPIK